jgi:hypothetical protein
MSSKSGYSSSEEKAEFSAAVADADGDADEDAERAILFRYGSEDRLAEESKRAESVLSSSPLARGMLLDLSFATSKASGRNGREAKDCIEDEEQTPIQETDVTGEFTDTL